MAQGGEQRHMHERPTRLRIDFHRELDEIHQGVIRLFAQVTEAVAACTEALLGDDAVAAARVSEGEESIDEAMSDLEERLERLLLLQAPVARDLRYVLSLIRIVPELERSGDLADHIARRAGTGLGTSLPPAIRGVLEQMGAAANSLWRQSSDAFADRDAGAFERLEREDDIVDDLHRQLLDHVLRSEMDPPVASEVTLIGRFYERIGDHAVHIAERVRYVAVGH
jgi:phosphate transport system protein